MVMKVELDQREIEAISRLHDEKFEHLTKLSIKDALQEIRDKERAEKAKSEAASQAAHAADVQRRTIVSCMMKIIDPSYVEERVEETRAEENREEEREAEAQNARQSVQLLKRMQSVMSKIDSDLVAEKKEKKETSILTALMNNEGVQDAFMEMMEDEEVMDAFKDIFMLGTGKVRPTS